MTKLRAFALACLFLFFVSVVTASGDTWWTLRVGQDLLAGKNIYVESWSWTANGARNPHHAWLWSLISYLLYLGGGQTLFFNYILQAGLLTLPFTLALPPKSLGSKLRTEESFFSATYFAVLPALFFLNFIPEVRPQGISFALFALVLFLVVREKYHWLPLVFLLWANLHAGFLTGFLVLGLVGILALAAFLRCRTPARGKRLKLVMLYGVLSLVVTLVNPQGFGLWRYLWTNVSKAKGIDVVEFQHAWFAPTPLNLWTTLALALAILSLLVFRGGSVTWELALNLCVAGVFSLLGLWVIRFLPFALIALLPLACAAPNLVPLRDWPGKRFVEARAGRVFLSLIACAAVLAAVPVGLSQVETENKFRVPQEASVKLAACGERSYNDYFSGAYLLWYDPDHLVFQDNRWDPYPNDVRRYIDLTPALWDEFQARWAVACVFTTVDSPTAHTMQQVGWVEIYNDGFWTLWAPGPGIPSL